MTCSDAPVLWILQHLKFELRLIAGKPGAMEIAQRLNAYHVRLRTINRRMMAAVSELALTQATGIKLKEEKGSAEATLRAAMRRVEVSVVFHASLGKSGQSKHQSHQMHIFVLCLKTVVHKTHGTCFGSRATQEPPSGSL